jgi:AraC-like DNA-binding protein
MPHLPLKGFVDVEMLLPDATSQSFWLKSSAWQFPDFENVETFVDRLVHDDLLVCDPVVTAVLQDQPHDLSPRTIRHRFLQATGMTRNQIYQIERAQRAAFLLNQGVSILDTAYELGYFDQPHLTRALKQWVGYTPAQLYRSDITCQFIQDSSLLPEYKTEYNPEILAKVP